MVSTLPANPYARLDIRRVEKFMNINLAKHNRNYLKYITVYRNYVLKQDITRWRNSISFVSAPILRQPPSIFLESDASDEGWGGIQKISSPPFTNKTNGAWFPDEIELKNNYLELKGAFFTILLSAKM